MLIKIKIKINWKEYELVNWWWIPVDNEDVEIEIETDN